MVFLFLLVLGSYNGLDPQATRALINRGQTMGSPSLRRDMTRCFQDLVRSRGLPVLDFATMISLQSYHFQQTLTNQRSIPFFYPSLGWDLPRIRLGSRIYSVLDFRG